MDEMASYAVAAQLGTVARPLSKREGADILGHLRKSGTAKRRKQIESHEHKITVVTEWIHLQDDIFLKRVEKDGNPETHINLSKKKKKKGRHSRWPVENVTTRRG